MIDVDCVIYELLLSGAYQRHQGFKYCYTDTVLLINILKTDLVINVTEFLNRKHILGSLSWATYVYKTQFIRKNKYDKGIPTNSELILDKILELEGIK